VTNRVYVTNEGDDTVSVVDGATNTVSATIPVGVAPLGVAVSETFNRIYVVNSADGTVSIIDGTTNTVIDTVAVGANPQFIGVLE
jgi:YVTN family beta-propeller protein